MRLTPLALAGLIGLTCTACQQGNLAQKEQKVETTICSQLEAAGAALEQVAALKPSSTVAEAETANQALRQAMTGLEKAETQLEQLRLQNFRTQLKTFQGEVAKVAANKSLTLAQAANELKGKAQPVINARRDLAKAVQCQSESSSPAAGTKKPD